MRRAAELYGAWVLGVLTTCGLAYWFYRNSGAPEFLPAEPTPAVVITDDTDDTGQDNIIAQVRARKFN